LPYASHRVDLHLVPEDPDAQPSPGWSALWARGVERGWWTADGEAGPRAEELVEGGFAKASLEWASPMRLVANGLGGFQVRCPACSAPLARAWQGALAAWRAGGPRELACPACGVTRDLHHLDLRPPAAFFQVGLHLADVGRIAVQPSARSSLEAETGPLRAVARRVG
jgi:hypothetical protein